MPPLGQRPVVGAIDPALGTTIATYSANGPTNDQRIKPGLSAAACASSFTFSPDCLSGTSAATPVVAGLAHTPAELKSYLLTQATVDRGAAGTDNTYGAGELILPDPPSPALGLLRVTSSPAVPTQISIDGVIANSWGLDWLKLPPGSYTVNVTAGNTTTVNGTFTQRRSLRVSSSPAVAGAISVDGIRRNDRGMWTDLSIGAHQVCFGVVPAFTTPACQNPTLSAGVLTTITGVYGP